MNTHAIGAIYRFEMARTWRTITQSIISPVLSTALYFVVFGSAIGSRIEKIGERQLRRVHRARPDHAVGAHAEHLERVVRHLLPEVHRHDLRAAVGADLAPRDRAELRRRRGDEVGDARPHHPRDRRVFVPLHIAHPVWMLLFLVLTAVTFSLFGFIIGIWADGFEKLQLIPMLIVMPLTFLGGPFYSINMLPPVWQKLSLLNPSVYLISGFRWSFFERVGDALRHQPLDDAAFFFISLWVATWILQRLAPQDLARAEPGATQ